MSRLALALTALCAWSAAGAESVDVKYRGLIDLAPFRCQAITRSSFIKRVCYHRRENYMLIRLKDTYYHYCEIPESVVADLLRAASMGRFYSAEIKGNFDCRINRMPAYK